ncbi:hypothetical protein SKAU_G00041620 [Synaphobranchus kaupii]|uniref:Uncharacterized protein n=1 Tax=Synaphobranchus kaupii TaxID=118154 RepID=A0A9Q1G1A0_SYNKA|nr:hypothetical protein SKAU_G00041620 [Synaphobranchus kaupii]
MQQENYSHVHRGRRFLSISAGGCRTALRGNGLGRCPEASAASSLNSRRREQPEESVGAERKITRYFTPHSRRLHTESEASCHLTFSYRDGTFLWPLGNLRCALAASRPLSPYQLTAHASCREQRLLGRTLFDVPGGAIIVTPAWPWEGGGGVALRYGARAQADMHQQGWWRIFSARHREHIQAQS